MIKNYFRILKKPHAHLQTILKTPVKFQKDRTKTVGGVKGTKYLLKIRNHAPCTTNHTPRPTENQNQCPSAFLRKGGEQKNRNLSKNYRFRKFELPIKRRNSWSPLHFKLLRFGCILLPVNVSKIVLDEWQMV